MSMQRFMDIQDDILKGQKEILESMNKVNSSTDKFNKGLKESAEKTKTTKESFSDINKNLEKQNILLKKGKEILSDITRIAKDLAGAFLAIFSIARILETVKGLFSLRQEMKDLSFQMFQGKIEAQELTKQITSLSAETGYAADRVATLYKELAESKVPYESLRLLTEASLRFSEATGVGQATASRLTAELTRMGRLGAKEVTNVLAEMLKAQRSFGISAANMERLSDGILESTRRLAQMGKNAQQIEKFTAGTTKLAGAFSSVGLEAGNASDIIQKLLDPGQLENNALLMSKLGLSMSDVLSGDLDPSDLVSRFKDLGQELKNMSGPAASAFAQQMGMSLFDLRQMAEMDESALADKFNVPLEGIDALRAATGEQDDYARSWSKTMESVKSSLAGALNSLLPLVDQAAEFFKNHISSEKVSGFVAKFTDFIKSIPEKLKDLQKFAPILIAAGAIAIGLFIRSFVRRFQGIAPDVSKTIQEGVEGGMEMGFEKSRLNVKEKIGDIFNEVKEDFQKRTKESADYAIKQARVAFYGQMSEQSSGMSKTLFAAAESLASGLGSYVKPLSVIEEFTKKIQSNTEQTLRANVDNYESLSQNSQNYSLTLGEEISRLESISSIEGVNTSLLAKKINSLKEEKEEIDKISENYEKAAIAAEETFIRRASKETLENMIAESAERNRSLTEEIGSLDLREKYLDKEIIAVNNILEGNEKRIQQLESSGELSANQQAELGKLQRDNLTLGGQLTEVEKERKEISAKIVEDLEKQAKEQAEIAKLTEASNKASSDTKNMGGFGAMLSNAKKSIGDAFAARMESAGTALKTGWVNFKAGLANAGKMMLTAAGNIARGAAKAAAGMAAGLLGAAMMMGPIQDIMAELKEPLKNVVETISKALAPALRTLIPVVTMLVDKLLLPLVKTLLPPIMTLLGFLIQGLGKLLEGIAFLARVFNKDVGDRIGELASSLNEAGESVRESAELMRADFEAQRRLESALNNLGITINRSANVEETLSKAREELANAQEMSTDDLRSALLVNAAALWKSIIEEQTAKSADVMGSSQNQDLVRRMLESRSGTEIENSASKLAEQLGISVSEVMSMVSNRRELSANGGFSVGNIGGQNAEEILEKMSPADRRNYIARNSLATTDYGIDGLSYTTTNPTEEELLGHIGNNMSQVPTDIAGMLGALVQDFAGIGASSQFQGMTGYSTVEEMLESIMNADRAGLLGITGRLMGAAGADGASPSQTSPSAAVFGVSETGEYLELREAAKNALSEREIAEQMLELQIRSTEAQENLLKEQEESNRLRAQEINLRAQEEARRTAQSRTSIDG